MHFSPNVPVVCSLHRLQQERLNIMKVESYSKLLILNILYSMHALLASDIGATTVIMKKHYCTVRRLSSFLYCSTVDDRLESSTGYSIEYEYRRRET